MRLLIIIIAFFAIAVVFRYSIKGTVFGISTQNKMFGGLFLVRELFGMVLIGVLLFEAMGAEYFRTFYVTEASIHSTSMAIIITLVVLLSSIGFFSKSFFKKLLIVRPLGQGAQPHHRSLSVELINAVAAITLLLVLWAHLGGARHAFFMALNQGSDLLVIRMSNRYDFSGPAHVMGFMQFGYLLLAVLLGLFKQRLSFMAFFGYAALVIYAATMGGGKAPLIIVLMAYCLGRLSFVQLNPIKALVAAISIAATSLLLVFVLVKIQFPAFDNQEVVFYIFERLGVGQIQGVYEQFGLRLRDSSYIFNEIPMSGIFIGAEPYSKDLMMSAGAYGMDPKSIGVMNSFFIGEAMAIGGETFMYASPIIVAFNYCATAAVLVWLNTRFFGLDLLTSQRIISLFFPLIANFTGDLGGLLFFKKMIAVVFFMCMVLLVFIVFRFFRVRFS